MPVVLATRRMRRLRRLSLYRSSVAGAAEARWPVETALARADVARRET